MLGMSLPGVETCRRITEPDVPEEERRSGSLFPYLIQNLLKPVDLLIKL
jgi:hypothetical protein